MVNPDEIDDAEDVDEGLGEWFESLDEGESIPLDSEIEQEGEPLEGGDSTEIPEVSVKSSKEKEIVEKLESRRSADLYRVESGEALGQKYQLPWLERISMSSGVNSTFLVWTSTLYSFMKSNIFFLS
ncbi:hypothetical protein AKJ50_02390, partial [candidate division MSBL1 archaeon SCGC-AAA382A13]